MLLPIIFTIIKSFDPLKAEIIDTTNSGAEVPKATIVKPISTGLMPIALARREDPLTRPAPPK